MARLSGTGLVADDLFLMAHDDVTGRPFLHPRALGLGLAGGVLADLMLAGRVRLSRGLVLPGDEPVPGERVSLAVLGVLAGERELHPVGDWLSFLAGGVAADVAVRLAGAGYLQREWPRRRRRAGLWVPVDPDWAFASLSRARPALERAGPPAYSTVLAGLAVACGLGPRLLPYAAADARQRLDGAVAGLAPGLRELVGQTQAAVDKAVLAHRT